MTSMTIRQIALARFDYPMFERQRLRLLEEPVR
jgi:hypothetical protein